MKKEMIYLPIKEFINIDLNFSIAENRKSSEFDFNFTRWKTLIFSSTKLKFILRYAQSVLQWLSKIIDVSNFSVSIDTTTIDRFNLSLYEFDNHIFNCTLFTNFYLISEEEWATKIYEMHFSKYDVVNGEPIEKDQTMFWKGEVGFEKFVNLLYILIKEPYKFESLLPIQWQIDFKDKKVSSSQIRMQLATLTQTGTRPEDPFLTLEQAVKIEQGVDIDKILTEREQEVKRQEVINPIWDEGIEQENRFRDINTAMRKTRGLEANKKRKKNR
ncbi:hypothetical protein [Spiroplasma endosymbiont of Labia minor]|uniref:hypothetical protein n=1 Tax=Spiroplasma endosymbiont of Labia minor TaxID=3066305 RepID=UPI0030D2B6BD